MMTNKKIFIVSIIVIILIVILIFLLYDSKLNQIIPSKSIPTTKSEVIISTDKDIYNKGKRISIVVNNGLDQDILYHPGGDRFWNIEYFEDDSWKKYGHQGRDGFQISKKNIGDNCYIKYYELSYPTKLITKSNITYKWDQKICPFRDGTDEPKIVQNFISGKYRLSFTYSFEMYEDDPFRFLDPKTVYSNTFIIK